MRIRFLSLWFCGAALLSLTCSSVLAASNLYRYRDSHGTVVLSRIIPPEAIKNGYEVLSPTGRVLEVIPPAPTQEELDARQAAEAEAERKQEEQRKQSEYDTMLLRLYSQPAEARQARDRRLQEIDSIIGLKRGNIQVLHSQIKDIETKAANIERSGHEVPKDMFEQINKLQANVDSLEQEVANIEKEKEATAKDFEEKIERLTYLQEKLEEARKKSDKK